MDLKFRGEVWATDRCTSKSHQHKSGIKVMRLDDTAWDGSVDRKEKISVGQVHGYPKV